VVLLLLLQVEAGLISLREETVESDLLQLQEQQQQQEHR
jgi:hypothetical protein